MVFICVTVSFSRPTMFLKPGVYVGGNLYLARPGMDAKMYLLNWHFPNDKKKSCLWKPRASRIHRGHAVGRVNFLLRLDGNMKFRAPSCPTHIKCQGCITVQVSPEIVSHKAIWTKFAPCVQSPAPIISATPQDPSVNFGRLEIQA